MANEKISLLTALGGAPVAGDLLPVVDVSDATDAASGTTKKMTLTNLLAAIPASGGYTTVQDEGSGLTQRSTVDFVGAGVTVTDTGSKTQVSIPGAGGGGGTFAGADFDKYRLIGVYARPNSTAVDTYGHAAVTPFADTTANADDADGPFTRRQTGASAGNTAGFDFNNGGLIQTRWLPQFHNKLKTFTSIADCRIWVGAFSGNPAGSDDPAVHGCGFRYSTDASDTTWKAWTNDASGGGTITDTGITVSTGTAYHLAIVVESASSIKFYISTDNGASYSLVATHTTNVPTSSQQMNDYFVIETRTSAARSLLHSFTHIRMR